MKYHLGMTANYLMKKPMFIFLYICIAFYTMGDAMVSENLYMGLFLNYPSFIRMFNNMAQIARESIKTTIWLPGPLCGSWKTYAYKSVARPSIGKSDHLIVHLLPKYKQLIKREKVRVKKVKVWNETAIENLQTCFDLTDWDMLISSAVNLNEAV